MADKNINEGIRYIVVGVLTTAVNYIFYKGFDLFLGKIGISPVMSYKLAYGIAFVAAVLFAFFANKYIVFRKRKTFPRNYILFRLKDRLRCCELFFTGTFGGCSEAYAYRGMELKFCN